MTQKPVKCIEYNMESFLAQCVQRYKDLSGAHNVKAAATPFYDDRGAMTEHRKDMWARAAPAVGAPVNVEPEAEPPARKGMHPFAARVLMKLLYAARMARFDLQKAINDLACRITDWDDICDKRLYRLVGYVDATKRWRMTSYVGDTIDQLQLRLFADADFAGYPKTKRSTSGAYFEVTGPNTACVLSAVSKRQRSVSTSTSEAEVIAAFLATCQIGIPAISLWSYLMGRTAVVRLCEDNQSAMRIIENGKSPALGHLSRTQALLLAGSLSGSARIAMQSRTWTPPSKRQMS